jgi:DNA mismatch repair protein MutL
VNQIAAGEVIERPASVVKELLENAIDAESSHLEIAIEEGGRKLIRLQDDGLGMAADDLALAVASHATSKLRSSDDLSRIVTFGFRGEALASIGSVSEMTITTRRAAEVEGHSITLAGGQASEVRVAGSAPGTNIEVRNLFFNMPARRKFLKTEATELGHIVDAVANAALAYPKVAIRVTHNGRTVHDLPSAESVRQRVAAFFGSDLAEKLIEIESESPAGTLWGLVAPPAETRASSRMQFLYVNGRYIRDRSLLHAVREAYRGLMEANRQPVVFLYLTVAPEDVDVNVHPTKIEVRLRNGQQLYRELLATLREKFLMTDLAPRLDVPLGQGESRAAPGETMPGDMENRESRIRQSLADFMRAPPVNPQPRFSYAPGDRRFSGSPTQTPRDFMATPPPPDRFSEGSEANAAPASSGELSGEDSTTGHEPRAIQLHNTYLVAETDEGMLIVDQHALHERVLYEELRTRLANGSLESQRLLIPVVLDVTDRERAFLEEHREHLARLGVDFELFGARWACSRSLRCSATGPSRSEFCATCWTGRPRAAKSRRSRRCSTSYCTAWLAAPP